MSIPQHNALIVFVRSPLLGKVKTRLAATVGNQQALDIYVQLLQHTKKVAAAANCQCFVFYADEIQQHDQWTAPNFTKRLQAGGDLGNRMQQAFAHVFSAGYSKVCIVGSDCPGLTTTHINNAFTMLNQCEVVIGPSLDGGYYLLATKQLHPALFTNIAWSTGDVLASTKHILQSLGLQYSLLLPLSDIDTEQDWLDNRHLLLV